MAKSLDQLPHISTQGGVAGGDFVLIKKYIAGVPLDFKIDTNSLFTGYLKEPDVGTEIGDLFRLVDDGLGNPGLPTISGSRLTNLNIPQASNIVEGAVTLLDSVNDVSGVTNGKAATPKAVSDLNALTFKKTGGDLTGTVKLPNNVPLRWNLQSGNPLEVLKLDVNNDLLVGNSSLSPDEIKLYTSNKVSINSGASEVFAFNADGSSSGIKAGDVSAPATTGISAGTVQSQISELNNLKLAKVGGSISGTLTLDNNISLSAKETGGTARSIVKMSTANGLTFGNTTNKTTLSAGTAGFSFLNSSGQEVFSIANNGTLSQINANQITYPTGTGGVTGATTEAAISWLGSNKIGLGGGTLSGAITLNNTVRLQGKNSIGTIANLAHITGANVTELGNTTTTATTIYGGSSGINFYTGGATRLSISNTGVITGLASDTIGFVGTGGLTSTNVQDAINEVQANALTGGSAEFDGTINFANNVGVTSRNAADTASYNTIKMTTANAVILGDNSLTSMDIKAGGPVYFRDSANTAVFTINAQAGTLTGFNASKISSTATGTTSATDVQSAIAELSVDKLDKTGGSITGALTLNNNTNLSGREVGGVSRGLVKVDTSDRVLIGYPANTLHLRGAGVSFRNSGEVELLNLSDAGTLSGSALKASQINCTVSGLTANKVETALSQLQSGKLGVTAKAADADKLDGLDSTAYARLGSTNTFTSSQIFDNDVTIGNAVTDTHWLSILGASDNSSRTGISIGEGGKFSPYSMHMYYTGDGNFHIGMGTMTSSTHAANRSMTFNHQNNSVYFLGNIVGSGNIYENGTTLANTYLGKTAKANSAVTADQLGGTVASSFSTTAQGDSRWLGITAKANSAVTADQLGGTVASSFSTTAQADAKYLAKTGSNTFTSPQKFNDNINLQFGNDVDSSLVFDGTNTVFNILNGNLVLDGGGVGQLTWNRSNGNITNSGSVTAPTFVGNLSGTATSATSAISASQLGGAVASLYARKDQANTFSEPVVVNNTLVPTKLAMYDDRKTQFGNNVDAELYYNSTSTYVQLDLLTGSGKNCDGFKITRNNADRLTFDKETGDLTVVGNIQGTSDERVKDDIQDIKGALAAVRAIGGQTFNRIDMDCPRQMGVIAQSVQRYFPEAVTESKEGQLSVAYGNLAAGAGFAAIDELATIVESQAEEIALLKKMVETLLEK